MRPELLEVEGFSAFRERTEVSFDDADLFAFWGPTGAGKSSLIDAIVFALYGSVPRYQNKNLVAPLISQQATEARVRLRFSLAGQRYTAARVVRADGRGGASTREARLEREETDGEPAEVLAGDADGVTAAVEALLGLSYEHFTTCVVLPQGDFARFLHHKPSERQGLLIRLLDLGVYARVARLAGERSAVARTRRELLAARLAELADRTPDRREALVARRDVIGRLVEAIDAARPELDRLTDDAAAAARRAEEAERWLAVLAGVAPPPGLDELAGAVAQADEAAARAEAERTAAGAAVAVAEQEAAGHRPLEDLAALAASWRQHGELTDLADRGRRAVAEAVAADDAARAGAAAADAARVEAEETLERARRSHLAADLASGLGPGDPCPVCGQTVADLPEHGGGDLAAARQRLQDAARAQAEAEGTCRRTAAERVRVEEKLAGVDERRTALNDALAGGPGPDEVAAALAAARAAAERLLAAREVVAAAGQRAERARARRAALDEAVAAAWAGLDETRDRVAGLGPPRPGRDDVGADWRALSVWADDRRDQQQAVADAARAQADEAAGSLAALVAQLEGAAAALGLAGAPGRPGRPGRPVRDAVVEARAAVEAELARFDRDVEAAAALTDDLSEAVESEQVAGALAGHLRATGFQKWLLDEALARLVVGASGILHQLSGGAYTLALDRRSSGFAVIDHHNADSVRSVRTLSGGETFLASLALALSLADQVVDLAAAGSARLESIFLDEGFGTLDPETLDVVAAAIEELGSQGRMVVLVSHVRDLAERVPVRFEVQKGPTTATVTRVEA